jgi:tRNA(adenine34) deaminase
VESDALMSAALDQAARGLDAGELPIGAVVALDGEILAQAFWRLNGALLAHPELLVLIEADRSPDVAGRRADLALYTTLEPCLLCMSAAMFSWCGRVVFALESPTDGGTAIGERWDPGGESAPYRFPDVIGGVRREDSLELVRRYVRRAPPSPLATWARTLVA